MTTASVRPSAAAACLGLLAVLVPAIARGHNPDTSYARLTIDRAGVTLRLTYDVTSLVRMVPGLDADADGRLVPEELAAAVPAITAFLRDSIDCEIDGVPTPLGMPETVAWPPEAGTVIMAADFHAPTSLVSFPFRWSTPQPAGDVWVRMRFFEALGLRHTVLAAIEHGDATQELVFTAFEPDYLYETSWPDAVPPAAAGAKPRSPGHAAADGRRSGDEGVLSRLWLFFRLGVEHILIGYDHILFLLALILVSDWRSLVRIVTAFTVAHSITLAVATLGWVEIPGWIVETAIAATIVYTALENLWVREPKERWRLTFLFGLVHGFGFAGVLRDLSLPKEGFVRALLAFNLGVEAGQLLIVAMLAAPASLLARRPSGRMVRDGLSIAIALAGLGWLVDRSLGTTIMPW